MPNRPGNAGSTVLGNDLIYYFKNKNYYSGSHVRLLPIAKFDCLLFFFSPILISFSNDVLFFEYVTRKKTYRVHVHVHDTHNINSPKYC